MVVIQKLDSKFYSNLLQSNSNYTQRFSLTNFFPLLIKIVSLMATLQAPLWQMMKFSWPVNYSAFTLGPHKAEPESTWCANPPSSLMYASVHPWWKLAGSFTLQHNPPWRKTVQYRPYTCNAIPFSEHRHCCSNRGFCLRARSQFSASSYTQSWAGF